MNQAKTGQKCSCKKGIERDNCPQCEGTGMRIDFKAIRESKPTHTPTPWDIYRMGNRVAICGIRTDQRTGEEVCAIDSDANAAFIVRAVNAYQPMLDALKQIKSQAGIAGSDALDIVSTLAEQAIEKAEGK